MLNIHSWDLKSLAFRRPLPVRHSEPSSTGLPYCKEDVRDKGMRASEAEIGKASRFSSVQSGFQPPCEPTGGKPMEHNQYNIIIFMLNSIPCKIRLRIRSLAGCHGWLALGRQPRRGMIWVDS